MAIIDKDPLPHQRDIAQLVKASRGGNNNRTFLTSYSISYNSLTCQTTDGTYSGIESHVCHEVLTNPILLDESERDMFLIMILFCSGIQATTGMCAASPQTHGLDSFSISFSALMIMINHHSCAFCYWVVHFRKIWSAPHEIIKHQLHENGSMQFFSTLAQQAGPRCHYMLIKLHSKWLALNL